MKAHILANYRLPSLTDVTVDLKNTQHYLVKAPGKFNPIWNQALYIAHCAIKQAKLSLDFVVLFENVFTSSVIPVLSIIIKASLCLHNSIPYKAKHESMLDRYFIAS